MFVTRKFYDQLVTAQTEARMLSEQVHTLRSALEWTRMRLTQTEKERAQLMYTVAGVKIAVPEFVQNPANDLASNFLGDLPALDDVGDEAADKMGIGWGEGGKIEYRKQISAKD